MEGACICWTRRTLPCFRDFSLRSLSSDSTSSVTAYAIGSIRACKRGSDPLLTLLHASFEREQCRRGARFSDGAVDPFHRQIGLSELKRILRNARGNTGKRLVIADDRRVAQKRVARVLHAPIARG